MYFVETGEHITHYFKRGKIIYAQSYCVFVSQY